MKSTNYGYGDKEKEIGPLQPATETKPSKANRPDRQIAPNLTTITNSTSAAGDVDHTTKASKIQIAPMYSKQVLEMYLAECKEEEKAKIANHQTAKTNLSLSEKPFKRSLPTQIDLAWIRVFFPSL